MKSQILPIPVTDLWQHLEFIQWASKHLKLARYRKTDRTQFVERRGETFKISSHGIGLTYSRHRGTEVWEQFTQPNYTGSSTTSWRPLNIRAYQEGMQIRRLGQSFPSYNTSIPADLVCRLYWWSNQTSHLAELRQLAMLSALLAYRPNSTHPSRR